MRIDITNMGLNELNDLVKIKGAENGHIKGSKGRAYWEWHVDGEPIVQVEQIDGDEILEEVSHVN